MRILLIVALALSMLSAGPAMPAAAQSGPVTVATGDVSYEFLERWDVDKLNQVMSVEMPSFSAASPSFTPARNAVKLYRVTYSSVIPERGNKPTIASGLLADRKSVV